MPDDLYRYAYGHPPDQRRSGPPSWWPDLERTDLPDDALPRTVVLKAGDRVVREPFAGLLIVHEEPARRRRRRALTAGMVALLLTTASILVGFGPALVRGGLTVTLVSATAASGVAAAAIVVARHRH